MELISVIVPVYNVEKYLEKCVNSLINQTYKNLEIILVNDGSPDNSGKLADELAKKDERIVVYHKENGGLSDARNYGVEKSKGDFIGFVDSDDYIHPDMYQHLYETIKKEDADVAECNFTFVYPNEVYKYQYEEEYYLKLDRQGYLKEYLLMEKLYGATACRLIKSNIAKSINFPVGKIYEDMYYALDLIKNAEKFMITSKPYYYYLVREDSITHEKFNDRQLTLIDISKEISDYAKVTYPTLENEANSREMYAYFGIMNQIIMLDEYKKNINYPRIKKYFQGNIFNILKNPVIDKKRKLSSLLLVTSTRFYKEVLKKYTKGLGKN
ncbi:MAG: glycosyltransferase [Gemella sp.]|nr:glycosyltransferase [Gemella sp.]